MQGYDVDIVDDGQKALTAVLDHVAQHQDNSTNQVYDLIFMDIQMPLMDGMTATKQIRERVPPEYQPYIVALTAQAMRGDREIGIAAGMNDYITKPVTKQELLRVISEVPRIGLNNTTDAAVAAAPTSNV